jgi:hypothetical protein
MDTNISTRSRMPVTQTESETKIDATQQSQNAAQEPERSVPLSKAAVSSMISEISISGQSRAAQLSSLLPPVGTGNVPATEVKETTLKNGDQGPEVQDMQHQINEWRVRNGKEPINEDGFFGGKTETAVREFQAANGLAADGMIGPNTRERISLENDPNFQQLPSDTQNQVREMMSQYDNKPTPNRNSVRPDRDPLEEPIGGPQSSQEKQMAKDNLRDLATDENFAKLPRTTQDFLLKELNRKPESPGLTGHVRDLAKQYAQIETNGNFQKLDPDTQKQFRDLMIKNSDNSVTLDSLQNLATNAGLPQSSKANQDSVIRAFQKNPTSENANEINRIVSSDGFLRMDEATRTQTLAKMETNAADGRYTNQLANMVSSVKFGALSLNDKQKMLNLFENTNSAGRDALYGLLYKTVDGKPALQKTDSSGTTLLDNLDKMASTPLSPRLKDINGDPQNKAEMLGDLLQEVNQPSQNIAQENRGTCAATVPTHMLAQKNPSEYARLITELSTKGQATLANGATLEPPSDAFREDNSGRSVGERLMQSGLMNYGRPDGNYRNNSQNGITDGTVPGGVRHDGYTSGSAGLPPYGQQKVMEGLFGKRFDHRIRNSNDDGKDFMKQIQDDLNNGKRPISASVAWGTGGHAVEIEKIENGRVYFRNPWGQGVGPNGPSQKNGPPRNVENSNTGEESMTIEEFQKIISEVTVEK